jgi:hypothetical protein
LRKTHVCHKTAVFLILSTVFISLPPNDATAERTLEGCSFRTSTKNQKGDYKTMILEKNKMQMEDSTVSKSRNAWGNGLIRFCAIGLVLSSLFKFSQLPGPIAYMASLGYAGSSYFLIAGMELLIALIFWTQATRPLGLLFVSAYFGGALSAHVASGHPSLARGPYMAYMLSHPLAGVIPACLLLASAWIGAWLLYPGIMTRMSERAESVEANAHPKTATV